MIGDNERRGIRLHAEVAFLITTLHDECVSVLA
jgi:hypothetical protein